MAVFVATSKRFYERAKRMVERLERCGVIVYRPYFELDAPTVDADPRLKAEVTRRHFVELDACDTVYALLPGGYIGCSVTIELTYAYARGKQIVVSEAPSELAVRPMVSEVCTPDEFLARFGQG